MRSPTTILLCAGAAALSLAPALRAQIVFHHDDGRQLVAADAAVERLATGRTFLEGPVWLAAERRLVCSDIPAKAWLAWTDADGLREWKPSAAANGNTIDRDGLVVSCQHEARNVVRHERDGALTVLADAHEGAPFHSPNDVVVRCDGALYFTDPTYGLGQRPRTQPGNFVYRVDPATKATRVVQRDFDQPNGLCFAPDHARLWIADSGRKQRVGAFPVLADGGLGDAELWLDGGSDGMRCDARGNLWTTARDGVRCYRADGVHLLTIALPEAPANCAFGGADGSALFVTARTSLYRVPLRVAGAAMPPPPATTAPSPSPQPPATTPPPKRAGDPGIERR
jgi:gluconolactonase